MEDKIKEILNLLEKEDLKEKQSILLECAVKIGTKEWVDEVNSLWVRMEKLNKGDK